MQQAGVRPPLLRHYLRLPGRPADAAAGRAARGLAQEMQSQWESAYCAEGVDGSPDQLIERHLDMRVFVLPAGTPLWTAHCALEEFDAIVVSGAFGNTQGNARPLYAELFRVLAPPRWRRPALVRRWEEEMAAVLGRDMTPGALSPPGENFARLLSKALVDGHVTPEEAQRLTPGAKRFEDVAQWLERHRYPAARTEAPAERPKP